MNVPWSILQDKNTSFLTFKLTSNCLVLVKCPTVWHLFFMKTDRWVGKKRRKKTRGQSITLQKVEWPPTLTRISRHGHYLPAACTDTQTACKQFCPHGTQLHSEMSKRITWFTGVLMILLTLIKNGTYSWRLLTMLIMEVSHRYPWYKTWCWWMSHWFSLDTMCFYLHLEHSRT